MTKKNKAVNAASFGVKVLSSALLIQQASALPAFANRGDGGQRLPHQERREAIAALRQARADNALSHFGVARLERADRIEARQISRSEQQSLRLENRLNRIELPRLNRLAPLDISYLNGNFDLDLSSTIGSIVVQDGMLRGNSPVEVTVGGTTKTIQSGDTITAAEFVALTQAQTRHGQTLTIDQSGKAVGGSFSLETLTSDLGVKLDDVLIPQNVQSVDTLSRRSQVTISGDLVNYGVIDQTIRGKSVDVIFSARDINNEAGALISGTSRGRGSVNLAFNSTEFQNDGQIITSGSIDINATGSSFKNSGEISAVKNVSIVSKNICNSGLVQSLNGDITVDSPMFAQPVSTIGLPVTRISDDGVYTTMTGGSIVNSSLIDVSSGGTVVNVGDSSSQLQVNNEGGTFKALNGNINVRSSGYNGKSDASVTGGDLLSEQVVLNSGLGTIDLNVNKLTGEVVSHGNAVHVQAATENLTIGSQCLTGDPTFFNSSGDISITGDIVVSEALAIVAKGSITSTVGCTQITARNGTIGQPITIIAGVNVTGTGSDTTTMPPGSPATGSVSYTGASTTGGNIDFTASTNLKINSNSTSGTNAGANILLAAYAAGGANGKVLLSTTSNIDASGATTASQNGVVQIFGTYDTAGQTAIQVGSVTHNSTTFGSDFLQVFNATPTILFGNTITFDKFGNFTAGLGLSPDLTQLKAGNIVFGASGVSASGAVTVAGGGDITAPVVFSTAPVLIEAGGSVNSSVVVGTAAGLTIVAGKDITINQVTTATNGSSAGDLTMVAGAQFTAGVTGVTVTGASATGGSIISNSSINTFSTVTLGDGFAGNLTLVALAGSTANSGSVKALGPQQNWSTTGSGFGTNGDLTVVASLIDIDAVTTGNGVLNGGDVVLSASVAPITSGNPLVIGADGSISSGTISGGTLVNSTLINGSITAKGQGVLLETAGDFSSFPIDASAPTFTGNGGSITIRTTSASELDFGASITVSGGVVSGNAGTITLSNPVGGIFAPALDTALTVVDGNGGTLILDAGTANLDLFTNLNVNGGGPNGNGGYLKMTFGSLTKFNLNPLFFAADGSGTGHGGTIELIGGGSADIVLDGTNFNARANSGASGGNGGTIILTAPGTVTLRDNAAISARALGPTGDGGKIQITAGNISAATFDDTPITLDVSAAAIGNGGSITMTTQTGQTIGTAPGQFILLANGGTTSGKGGAITVDAAQNIIVNPANISANPLGDGDGGTYVFDGSTVIIQGSLSANGAGTGNGGTIRVITNSTTDLIYNSKKAINGVIGTLSVNGALFGDIELTNTNGNVYIPVAITNVGDLTLKAGGSTGNITATKGLGGIQTTSVTINSIGGVGNIVSKKAIIGDSLNFATTNGTIGGKKPIKIVADTIDMSAKGTINLSNQSDLITVNDFSTNADFKLATTGNVNFDGTSNAVNVSVVTKASDKTFTFLSGSNISANAVTLNAGKGASSIIDNAAVTAISANTVTLIAKDGTVGLSFNPFDLQATALSIQADGGIGITNNGSGQIALNDLTTSGVLRINSAGTMLVNTSMKNASDITLSGAGTLNDVSIILNSSIGSFKATGPVMLRANGLGSITSSSSKYKIQGAGITIRTEQGGIGTSNSPLSIDGRFITLQTQPGAGDVFVNSLRKVEVDLTTSISSNLKFNAASSLVVNTTTAKSVDIFNAGGTLFINGNISTTDGGIVLNNGGSGKNPLITFTSGISVASMATAPGGGTISVFIGDAPPPQVVGTTPGNVNVTGNGIVFFNEGITANGATSTLDTKNTNIIFSAGGFGAGAIILQGGNSISADPPLPAPAVMTTASTRPTSRPQGGLESSATSELLSVLSDMETTSALPSITRSVTESQYGLNTERLSMHTANLFGNDNSINLNTTEAASGHQSGGKQAFVHGMSNLLLSMMSSESYKEGWISETELETGEIPAIVHFNETISASQQLQSGSMLVAPMKDASVQTPLGAVHVAANSLVLVMAFSNGVAVFNFDDANRNAVRFEAGGKSLSVSPGQSVIVTTNNKAALCDINPAQLIAHRSVSERQIGSGLKAIHSEFSVPSALAAVVPIKQLMNSKHPHAVRTSKHLLKTSSVLMHLQTGGSAFTQHRRPQRTAMSM